MNIIERTPTPWRLDNRNASPYTIAQTGETFWLLDNERKRATPFNFMSTALAAQNYADLLPRVDQIEFQEQTLVGTRDFVRVEK
jgi:hypothetical protein